MTPTQRAFALFASVSTFLLILELVRRRRLKEEYSWLWILTSLGMVVLSGWYTLITKLSRLIGAVTPTTTLFLFAFLFLLMISVHVTTVISRLTQQVRRLTQEVAILSAELHDAPCAEPPRAPDPGPDPGVAP